LAVLPYTEYPLIVQFAGGVTPDQLTPIALDDVAVAVTPVGAEGTAVHDAPPLCVSMLAWFDAAELPNESVASTT
jgi:hypothetical protein